MNYLLIVWGNLLGGETKQKEDTPQGYHELKVFDQCQPAWLRRWGLSPLVSCVRGSWVGTSAVVSKQGQHHSVLGTLRLPQQAGDFGNGGAGGPWEAGVNQGHREPSFVLLPQDLQKW